MKKTNNTFTQEQVQEMIDKAVDSTIAKMMAKAAEAAAASVAQPVVPSAPKTRKEIMDNNVATKGVRALEGGINWLFKSAVEPALEYAILDAAPVAAEKTAVAVDYSGKKLCAFAKVLKGFASTRVTE